MTPELGIVVVHYRVPEVLAPCLDLLRRFVPEADVVLVDTAPDEAVLASVAHAHPRLSVVRAPNHSLAHAVNLGIKHTRTRWVAYMNADVYVEADTFAWLRRALEARPRAGIAGPLALTRQGRPQEQGPDYRLHYLRLRRTPGAMVTVPWLAGCLQLMRREVLERCGGLDPSLRFYNEDIEFCMRANRAGFASLLVATPVLHLGGTSTPSVGAFMVEGRRGGMQLSRRYYPPAVRFVHRTGLLAEAAVGMALSRDAAARQRYLDLLRMVRRQAFDESPFGATLGELRAPAEQRP